MTAGNARAELAGQRQGGGSRATDGVAETREQNTHTHTHAHVHRRWTLCRVATGQQVRTHTHGAHIRTGMAAVDGSPAEAAEHMVRAHTHAHRRRLQEKMQRQQSRWRVHTHTRTRRRLQEKNPKYCCREAGQQTSSTGAWRQQRSSRCRGEDSTEASACDWRKTAPEASTALGHANSCAARQVAGLGRCGRPCDAVSSSAAPPSPSTTRLLPGCIRDC